MAHISRYLEVLQNQSCMNIWSNTSGIGSKREQILLSNEELINDLQNNQQNQAVVKETIEFLRKELDDCERTQMELNCSEETLTSSLRYSI